MPIILASLNEIIKGLFLKNNEFLINMIIMYWQKTLSFQNSQVNNIISDSSTTVDLRIIVSEATKRDVFKRELSVFCVINERLHFNY